MSLILNSSRHTNNSMPIYNSSLHTYVTSFTRNDLIQVSLIAVQKMVSIIIVVIHIFEVYYSQGG